MEKRTEFFGGPGEEEDERRSENKEVAENTQETKKKSEALNDSKKIGITCGAIIGINLFYWILEFSAFQNANHFLKDLILLIMSLLLVALVDSVLNKSRSNGAAVILSLLFSFILSLSIYYFGPTNAPANKAGCEVENPVSQDKGENSFSPVLITGQQVFELKANEETPWFGFEEGQIVDYSISSPTYDYDIIISDGTRYAGGPNVVIPEKKHCYFKVIAKSKQLVTVSVKK